MLDLDFFVKSNRFSFLYNGQLFAEYCLKPNIMRACKVASLRNQ